MTPYLFTGITITFFVLLSYAVEQLGNTYTEEIAKRQAYFDELDALSELEPDATNS